MAFESHSVGFGGSVRRLAGDKIRHVEAGPLFLTGVPINVTLPRRTARAREFERQPPLFGPGVARDVGGGPVVHEAAIGGPRKAPAKRDPIVALAVGRLVLAVGINAGVDPCPTSGRTV